MARKQVQFNENPLLRGPSLAERARSGSPYRELAVGDIDVDPDQPRRVFDPGSLSELAASIKEYGVLCPILVRLTGPGSYRLVAGERRLRACKLVGIETIPAVIDGGEEGEPSFLAKQLIENLQREDLSSMERALAIGQLRDRFSWSIREVAKRLGASKALVQRSLEILNLPDDLQAALIAGAAESKVLLLSRVEDRETRKELISEIDELTRDQLEERIQGIGGSDQKEGKGAYLGGTRKGQNRGAGPLSPEDRRIVEEIQRTLGTKVALTRIKNKKGQGKLVIEFYSEDDLGEVYSRLTREA